jgi:hypothetical protein
MPFRDELGLAETKKLPGKIIGGLSGALLEMGNHVQAF